MTHGRARQGKKSLRPAASSPGGSGCPRAPGQWSCPRHAETGFTLLEMLVALVVLSIGVLGYIAVQYQGIGGRTFSGALNKAVTSGMSNLEEIQTIDFEQMTGTGTWYRFKSTGADATAEDFEAGHAYRIDWTVEPWTPVSPNPNSFLAELKTIKAFIRWKEKGVESSAVLFTFDRGQKTGDVS